MPATALRGPSLPNPSDTPLHFTFFWTGNLSAPRADLLAVGGFDERFRRPLFEDTELGYRLGRHGLPLFFDPTLECGHDHAIAFGPWLARAEAFGHEWTLFASAHGTDAMPILAQFGDGTALSQDDLWTTCLHEHHAHEARVAALSALLDDPDGERVLRNGLALFDPIHIIARMRGVLAGLLGHTPEDLARHRRRGPLALVHTLFDTDDLEPLEALYAALPDDAHLLLSHDPDLDAALTAHPMGQAPRTHLIPFGDSPWRPLLVTSPAETFILLSGAVIPSAPELVSLASFLDTNPTLGAVTLGPPGQDICWRASLVDPAGIPADVVATTRSTLANDTDRPVGLAFFGRIVERGLRLALVTPSG